MNRAELEKSVENSVKFWIDEKGYVCAVDVLLKLNLVTKKDYDDWRFGRVSYLERVCKAKLKQLSLINQVIRSFAGRAGS